MAGINIPGVTNQYNTNETVEKLMKVERIPLTREQNQLEEYKAQKDAWREVNANLTSLRDSTKSLYSYENPFNNKLAASTEENAITAEANRSADFQEFKVDVIQPATADRFLTSELKSDYEVPSGMYTYKVGDKQININWKGGNLKSFSDAINKRSNGVVKSMIIGSSAGKKTLLIESLTTGKENRLIFENKARDLAIETGMISPAKSDTEIFGTKTSDLSAVKNINDNTGLPQLSLSKVLLTDENIKVEPRGAFSINLSSAAKKDGNHIQFSIKSFKTDDITLKLNEKPVEPEIPDSGFAEYKGIVIKNNLLDMNLKTSPVPKIPVESVSNKQVLFAITDDGSEIEIPYEQNFDGSEIKLDIDLKEYPGIKSIAVKNSNTDSYYEISEFKAFNPSKTNGYIPNHPITEADDAIIKYEGITITRPGNKIDDVIPEVTLNIKEKTEKTATISIKPDTEASKNALIEFVGKYNQAVAKINILSQNKPEIVEELDYLSDEEKKTQREKLGMFETDFSLTNIKSNMQTILSTQYPFDDDAQITMLSQIGISTNASGASGSYSQSRLRGYLEIDEKKLDSALENHLNEIKNIFGYDSDGDLIIDSGIAYKLDKQITAYTQTGGILALKTSSLDSKIKSSEAKISKLELQMDEKEADLRMKYGRMEGTLNSLESQQNSISNFTKQQNRNN